MATAAADVGDVAKDGKVVRSKHTGDLAAIAALKMALASVSRQVADLGRIPDGLNAAELGRYGNGPVCYALT
jgi:hypothetical protein